MKQTELNLRNNVYEYSDAPLHHFSIVQKVEHIDRALWELGLEPCDLHNMWLDNTNLQVVQQFLPQLHIQVGENCIDVDVEYSVTNDGKVTRMLMSRDSIRRLVQTYQQILGGSSC